MLVGIIIGFIALTFLVVAHEFGHALAARRNGVVVEEFGIGMPPKIWKKKLKSGINFSINWLFIGGFVKLQGEYDEASKKGDYGSATFWQKTKILLAGVAVNWLVAVVILTTLSFIGLPKVLDNQFSIASDSVAVLKPVVAATVVAESAAAKAGIKSGDIIIEFDGIQVKTDDQLLALLSKNKGKSVNILYSRSGKQHNTLTTLGTDKSAGYLGVGLGQRELVKYTWSAPIVGLVTTAQFSYETVKSMGQLIGDVSTNVLGRLSTNATTRKAASAKLKTVGDSMAGPVGIVGSIFPSVSQSGPTQIALLIAIISISLAVMNVFPIPALDGGRWFTMATFRLFRKKLTFKREEVIQTFGFFVMIGLIILVTILDVKKLL